MLAQHISIDGGSSNTALLSEDTTQTCAVEESATTNDLRLRESRKLLSKVSQDIHGV